MNQEDKNVLVQQVAALVEQTFRHGYRQGFQIARSSNATEKAENEVYDWFLEFCCEDDPKYCVCPPSSPHAGHRWLLLEMLHNRLADRRLKDLKEFLFSTPPPD